MAQHKFIDNIKNQAYVEFVKEAKAVLEAQHEKQIREYMAVLLRSGELVKESQPSTGNALNEAALTRKHFKVAADAVKAIEDKEKRKEIAKHHAEIFSKSNPRFDRKRFMQAANVDEDQTKS